MFKSVYLWGLDNYEQHRALRLDVFAKHYYAPSTPTSEQLANLAIFRADVDFNKENDVKVEAFMQHCKAEAKKVFESEDKVVTLEGLLLEDAKTYTLVHVGKKRKRYVAPTEENEDITANDGTAADKLDVDSIISGL